MNILFMATNFPYPPDSGHNLRTYNILKILAENNNIYFCGFYNGKKNISIDTPVHKLCKSVELFKAADDYSKINMAFSLFKNLFSKYPYVLNKYYLKEMKNKIKKTIISKNIDLVHFDLLHLSRYIDSVGETPKVLTEHNVESARVLTLVKNSKNPLFKQYMYVQYKKLYRFEKKACGQFDACIAVSSKDEDSLRKMNPAARYYVIPNGVDTEYFKPAAMAAEPDSLVWVGGMHDLYNKEAINYFCQEIFPLLYNKIRGIKFKAIGTSPPQSLRKLSLSNKHVEITGYVEDIRPYVSSATIFVAPMLSGGGTKLKVLNAMSMGKPVVTTTVGAEGIDVKNGENIVIADNPEDFATETMKLLKNAELATQIGDNGRKLIIKKYSWDVIGKKQLNLYNSMIRR